MALRVARDPDLLEAVADLGHCLEQLRRAVVLAGRLVGVAGHDEHVVGSDLVHPREDLVQVSAIAHESRRDVRDDLVPMAA